MSEAALTQLTGRIVKAFEARGYGIIQTPGGSYYFAYAELAAADPPPRPRKGARVEFVTTNQCKPGKLPCATAVKILS